MPQRLACCLLAAVLLPGCGEDLPPTPEPPAPRADAGRLFEARSAGAIAGRVVWRGPRPAVVPFRSIDDPLTDAPAPPPARDWANPNAPVIGPEGGVASAVVFLRGVDPARGRPWDHPPVRVELRGRRFGVVQGGPRRVGFARAGGEVELVSREPVHHTVQARGAAFFAAALPVPEESCRRRLPGPGVVELASGSGFFWMRAYLLVDHHPYYALTDPRGQFRLAGVPPGEYDLVAWHPDPRVRREERNQESFRIQQVRFAAPLSHSRRVRVGPGAAVTIDLHLGEGP